MNRRPDTGPDVLELVRRVDPLHDPRAASEASADAEAALRVLRPRLDRPVRRRRRRRALRIGVVALGAAAAALAVIDLAPAGHGRLSGALEHSGAGITPARAAMIVRKARAALLYPAGAIVEQEVVTTTAGPDGSTVSTDEHWWYSTSAPYDARHHQSASGGPTDDEQYVGARANPYSSAMFAGGRLIDYYDAATDTIYVQRAPQLDLAPGPSPGTQLLTVPTATLVNVCSGPLPAADRGTVRLTVTDAQVAALRANRATVSWDVRAGNVATDPQVHQAWSGPGADPNVQSTRALLQYLLRRRGAQVDPHASLDGAPAVRIAIPDSSVVYWAQPGTCRPLQVQSRTPGGTVTTGRYRTYRVLTGADASPDLLSLGAQHPGAKVDGDPGDYIAERCRLHGG